MTTRRNRQRAGPPGASHQSRPAASVGYGTLIVLGLFAAVFVSVSVGAYTRTSATWDEPIHLTAGYAAATHHDFRIDPSHPPLYYFPAAFVLKTPLAMLLVLGIGTLARVRRRAELGFSNMLFVLVPAIAYLGVAMASGINIGLRHILPIYPFLILIVAVGIRELMRLRRPVAIAALSIVGVAWAAEFGRAYPYPLTFFNALAGGPAQGYRYLSDSNLAWGQSLKPLKTWMDRNGVSHINLAYFGQADPAYYGIDIVWNEGSDGCSQARRAGGCAAA